MVFRERAARGLGYQATPSSGDGSDAPPSGRGPAPNNVNWGVLQTVFGLAPLKEGVDPSATASRTSSASRQGYVPATRTTFRMSKEEAEPTSRSHYATSPRQSWKNLWADIKGAMPTPAPSTPAAARDERQRQQELDVAEREIALGLNSPVARPKPSGYVDAPDFVLEALTGDPVEAQKIQSRNKRLVEEDEEWRREEAARLPSKVTFIDESDPEAAAWGVGYQARTPSQVAAAVAEPVEMSLERYNSLSESHRSAVDFNTLLAQAQAQGTQGQLSELLGMEITEDDQMITQASFRQLGELPGKLSEYQTRVRELTGGTSDLAGQLFGPPSGDEYATVSAQLNSLLADTSRQNALSMDEVLAGGGGNPMGQDIRSLPTTQAFEVIFNDLADASSGDWDYEDVLAVLEPGGYNPDEFWQWASDRIYDFETSGRFADIAPVEEALSIPELKQRLQIGIGD